MGYKIYHRRHAWESVNSYGDEFFRGGDEKGNDALSIPDKVFKADFHRRGRFEVLQTFRGQRTAPPPHTHHHHPMTEKISIFAGWASMLVVQSVHGSKSHSWCHFYLGWKIAFSIKVRDGLLTELWLRLQSPWDHSTDPPPHPLPCILLNHPPTHKPTHLRAPCTGTHTNKRTLSPPAAEQSLFLHQIHKVYLTWAFTQKEHFPAVPLQQGNIVTNNPGFKLVPLKGAFTL